jgi:hypothetical protein
MPLLCGLALRNNWRLAIGSPGAAGGNSGRNPASGGVGRPGKVGRRTRDSPATVLGAWLESGSRRQGRMAAATAASRCAPRSGVVAAGEKKWSGSAASVGARGGGGYRSWAMRSAGTWVHRDDLYWHRRAAQARWQGAAECRDGGRLDCHTRLSEENQVYTYMHARIKFHAYSDIKVNTENSIT